ncbi:hypothetical protein [Rhizobium azibense]|uniref:Uncharacterized protein n=1 Tax=Rhizobium azibense TaxID=1136135 RepID=A0A4R3R7Y3_9HYPH|nr:hypothetical protein [Rhizobium azibense]TCU31378.1 hypothetical protein EV129_1284 [Rhizobium azibense]
MTHNQVLANPLEWETPAARLRQIAMPRVAEITGLGRGAIRQTVGLLVQRGLLIKDMEEISMKRGMPGSSTYPQRSSTPAF